MRQEMERKKRMEVGETEAIKIISSSSCLSWSFFWPLVKMSESGAYEPGANDLRISLPVLFKPVVKSSPWKRMTRLSLCRTIDPRIWLMNFSWLVTECVNWPNWQPIKSKAIQKFHLSGLMLISLITTSSQLSKEGWIVALSDTAVMPTSVCSFYGIWQASSESKRASSLISKIGPFA